VHRADPTLLYRSIGSLVLLVHAAVPPAADEWTEYVSALEAVGRNHPEQVTLLVIGESSGPSAAQREELKMRAPRNIRTAVVTNSTIARTIVTILGWVTPSIQAFLPANIDGAFDHLSTPREARPEILKRVAALRVQVAGIGVNTDEAAIAILDAMSIDPKVTILSALPALRSELLARRRA
jgi:hypothetical protein